MMLASRLSRQAPCAFPMSRPLRRLEQGKIAADHSGNIEHHESTEWKPAPAMRSVDWTDGESLSRPVFAKHLRLAAS